MRNATSYQLVAFRGFMGRKAMHSTRAWYVLRLGQSRRRTSAWKIAYSYSKTKPAITTGSTYQKLTPPDRWTYGAKAWLAGCAKRKAFGMLPTSLEENSVSPATILSRRSVLQWIS